MATTTPLDPSHLKTFTVTAGHTYNYYTTVKTNKPTILFLHGHPVTANIWRQHIAFFEAQGYGCLAPDILGHGKSSKSHDPKDYVAKHIASSIVELLDTERVHKAIVIGHDLGGSVGGRIAMYHPERVEVLVTLAIGAWPPAPFDLQKMTDEMEAAFGHSIFGYWEVMTGPIEFLVKGVSLTCSLLGSKLTDV